MIGRGRAIILSAGAVAAIGVIVLLAVFRAECPKSADAGGGAMGTQYSISLRTNGVSQQQADQIAAAAAEQIKFVERQMNVFDPASPLAKLNAAGAGQKIPLPPELVDVLRASQNLAGTTGGAFDATCLPIIKARRAAFSAGRLPTAAELAAARRLCGWSHFAIIDDGAGKFSDGSCIDLGGIAKGSAVDLAISAIRGSGVVFGAMVDIGGSSIGCFGQAGDGGEKWRIGIKNPLDPAGPPVATIRIDEGFVSTSGGYEKFTVIVGRRENHIIDPWTGQSADGALSATVIAPTAALADAWSTALCVLGRRGLTMLPKDFHAMIVVQSGDGVEIFTAGKFAAMADIDQSLLVKPASSPASMPTTAALSK